MTRQVERVCVIGAGLAGLACALAAARSGLSVQMFEATDRPQAVKAHVEVVPNMLRDLVALGVGDDCVRAGFPYLGTDVVDRQGRLLCQLPTERLAGPRYPAALGILHDELHSVLRRAALARGVTLTHGARVEAIRMQGTRARMALASGDPVDADLVVLATGARSELRTALFPQAQATADIGQAWWYTLVPRPLDLDRPLIAGGKGGQRVVLVPVRGDTAGLTLIEPMPAPLPSSPAAHLRDALVSFAPRVRALASQFAVATPIALRPAGSGLLAPPWHQGAVLAVGDCAHALPPHFGQALAQAIEDACVLGELLADKPDRTRLFEAFQQRRTERVRRVHELTATAASWDLQPDSGADLSVLTNRLASAVAQPA